MSEPPSFSQFQTLPPPPPAPPLPPPRLGPLQRFIAPLGLSKGSRPVTNRASSSTGNAARPAARRSSGSLTSTSSVQHRTGIPIAAIDINRTKTHAILAGRDILKTVRVHEGKATEDFNLRSSIVSYASTHGSPQGDAATRRREYLPARDVKWSTGELYPHIVATAAINGRISLYDVNAAGSRIELAWLHEHTGQVNKIDIDPFAGRYLLSASQDKSVKLWDIRDPKATKSKSKFDVRTAVRHVCWSPTDGNDFDFAVCADGGMIQNWDARNPLGPKVSIHAHERGCYSLDWHPDGRHVVSGGFDKYVRVWDFKSDSRRQKPVYQFRVPQAVRSVSWRPISENEHHVWRTSQIATTYHESDPRIHVWDLKRPSLPYVELADLNQPANDFLWASNNHIWTAADDGVFNQYDASALPRTDETLPPSAISWLPGGQNAMFLEERIPRNNIHFDPSAFLSIPKDKLSSGDESVKFKDAVVDEFDWPSINTSSRSRQVRDLSQRSDVSRASSPSEKRHIQQLDKTVNAGYLLLQNDQLGAIGSVPSAPEDMEVASFLANNYAPIASESQRRKEPELVLSRLETSFMKNADVCDEVALHRLAQSWRMIAAVVIPELQDWVANNRAARTYEAEQRKTRRKAESPSSKIDASPTFSKMSARDRSSRLDSKDSKLMSNLFRGLKDLGKSSEQDSSSNMTTPMARPLPDSPKSTTQDKRAVGSPTPLSVIEDIPPLPESLLNSHATAAAAAYALNDDEAAPPSSLTSPRRKKHDQLQPTASHGKSSLLSSSQALDPSEPVPRASPFLQAQRQEERRAALRDYRAQARPIFSLETQAKDPDYSHVSKHDSAESFPMFSASTGSSHKARSMGLSASSQEPNTSRPQRQDSWLSREDSTESSSASAWTSGRAGRDSYAEQSVSMREFSFGADAPPFNMDDTPELEKEDDFPSDAADVQAPTRVTSQDPAVSSSPEVFEFDHGSSPAKPRIHALNPIMKRATDKDKVAARAVSVSVRELEDAEIGKEQIIFQDLRPIDMSTYQPKLPFAWSSLPLLCHLIAYDIDSGVACAQFSAHLLLHLMPYFFTVTSGYASTLKQAPESLAERLMRPELAERIIESTLRKHLSFLHQLHLFVPLVALRKSCVDLGLERVSPSGAQQTTERSVSSNDPFVLATACSRCGSAMAAGQNVCGSCAQSRATCAVCFGLRPNKTSDTAAWVVCQSCGHATHFVCMQRWQSQAGADGNCPSEGCGCDCTPGRLRKARIERQAKAYDEKKLIRGAGTTSAKRDSVRASHSPAVDRTRAVMRAASGERAAQSGDERGGRRASGRSSMGNIVSSSRKSVRLVTPGEERNPAA